MAGAELPEDGRARAANSGPLFPSHRPSQAFSYVIPIASLLNLKSVPIY